MPVYLRPQRSPSPWFDFERAFELHHEGKKIFAEARHPTNGYIIALWEDEANPMPTHYLWRVQRRPPAMSESIVVRRKFYGSWKVFNSPTEREDPLQHSSLSRVLSIITTMREVYEHNRVGIVYWQHPENAYQPKDRYLLMQEGNEFPGSPRQ